MVLSFDHSSQSFRRDPGRQIGLSKIISIDNSTLDLELHATTVSQLAHSMGELGTCHMAAPQTWRMKGEVDEHGKNEIIIGTWRRRLNVNSECKLHDPKFEVMFRANARMYGINYWGYDIRRKQCAYRVKDMHRNLLSTTWKKICLQWRRNVHEKYRMVKWKKEWMMSKKKLTSFLKSGIKWNKSQVDVNCNFVSKGEIK